MVDSVSSFNYQRVLDGLSDEISDLRVKENIVGLSIAVVHDQEIIWAKGFGYQDRSNGLPATENTVYRMGSISKVFTGTAIMQLVEQGLLDIDAPITTYIPDFSIKSDFNQAEQITLRHLMTHHSGLPTELMRGADSRNPDSLGQFVENLKTQYLAQEPGRVFQYSNVGFALLGYVVESATGQDFGSHVVQSLFLPLDMSRSSFDNDFRIRPHLSKGYIQGKECEQYPVREKAAASMYASVRDVAKFIKLIFAGGKVDGVQVVSESTIGEMLTRQNKNNPLDLDVAVGLTWQLTNRLGADLNAGPTPWHDGRLWHFSSSMILLPKHKLGVVVATNSDSGQKWVSRIGIKAMKKLLWEKSGVNRKFTMEETTAALVSEAQLAKYAGYYDTTGGLLKLVVRKSCLEGILKGKQVQLQSRRDGSFIMKRKLNDLISYQSPELEGVVLRFVEVGDAMILATMDNGQRIPFGHRITRTTIPKGWRSRVGKYINRTANTDFVHLESVEIKYGNGLLTAQVSIRSQFVKPMQYTVALNPVSKNRASVMGVGRNRGDMLIFKSTGHREILGFQGYHLVKTK